MDIDWWLIVVAGWVAIGVVTGLVMGRRGFSAWSWLFIGVVLGPLVVPLAVASIREGRPVMLERLSEGRPSGGGYGTRSSRCRTPATGRGRGRSTG